jgi:hypothetical protein
VRAKVKLSYYRRGTSFENVPEIKNYFISIQIALKERLMLR